MKRFVSMMMLAACVSSTLTAAVKKTNLKVLYVGGHAEIETFGNEVDKNVAAKSAAERTEAWKKMLETYFTNVKTVKGDDYNYKMSYDYDVTIIDGDPKPLEPRRTLIQNGTWDKIISAKYFPDDFDRPVITIADASETVGRRMGVKNDWYCLCLTGYAYNMQTQSAIFKGPYKVKLTTEKKPTPVPAVEYGKYAHETVPATVDMWKVQDNDYESNPNAKVGMVTRPWGYLDSPDTEILSGGKSAKCYNAIAIGRHANWLHWGFGASPAHLTDEAKNVFANAVVYINKYKGHRVIARKIFEGTATRETVDEQKYSVSRENYEDYKHVIEESNQQIKHMADSLKQVEAAGGTLTEMDKAYIEMGDQPRQPVPGYEDYVKERAGDLYEKFGTDVAAYEKYYTENRNYFYCPLGTYNVQLDEDVKSLGIANNDKKLLDKAITLWEQNQDVEKAKRILYRYTLLRYTDAKQFRAWYNKYQQKLFFTESGGWLWLVNDLDPKTPGNDYSVLKYNEIDESTLAPMKDKATKEDPVAFSSAVVGNGGESELVIRMKIYPGYHIYSMVSDDDPYIQTSYDFATEGDIQFTGELQKPAGKLNTGSKSIVYEGEQVLRRKFTGKNGKITLTIKYQACDNHACLMPKTKVIEVEM